MTGRKALDILQSLPCLATEWVASGSKAVLLLMGVYPDSQVTCTSIPVVVTKICGLRVVLKNRKEAVTCSSFHYGN